MDKYTRWRSYTDYLCVHLRSDRVENPANNRHSDYRSDFMRCDLRSGRWSLCLYGPEEGVAIGIAAILPSIRRHTDLRQVSLNRMRRRRNPSGASQDPAKSPKTTGQIVRYLNRTDRVLPTRAVEPS